MIFNSRRETVLRTQMALSLASSTAVIAKMERENLIEYLLRNSLFIMCSQVFKIRPQSEEEDLERLFMDKVRLRNDFRKKKRETLSHTVNRKKRSTRRVDRRKKTTKIAPHSDARTSEERVNFSFLRNISDEDAPGVFMQIINSVCSSKIVLKGKQLLLWILEKFRDVMDVDLYAMLKKMISRMYLKVSEAFTNLTIENVNHFVSNVLIDWEACKKNPAFSAIITLATVVVAYLYGSEAKIVLGIGALSFLTLDASRKCNDATTLFEAVLVILKSVTAGISQFKSNGSLQGFIYGDEPMTKFMEKVTEMNHLHQSFLPGNLELHHDMKTNEYEFALRSVISQGRRLLNIYVGAAKSTINANLQKVENMLNDVIVEKTKGGLREAPFAISVFGSSGVGKSTVNEILTRSILMSNGFDHRREYIAYLNPNDEYLSNFKTYTLGAIIDDGANTKTQFAKAPFSNLVIALVNNAPYVLNKAELAEKGKVTALLKVLGVTTNVPCLEADVTSNMPSSVVRRFLHVKVEVKPEFTKGEDSLSLDSAKVVERFGDDKFPDVWNLTLYEIVITPVPRKDPKDKQKDDEWKFEVLEHEGMKCKNIGIRDAVQVLSEKSKDHFRIQKIVVRNSESWDEMYTCPKCKNMKGSFMCECTDQEETISPHAEKIYLRVNSWRMTLREFALTTTFNRKKLFSSWVNSRSKEVSQMTMDILDFLFRVFDEYVERHKVALRELLIPNIADEGLIGDYISEGFRSETKYLRWFRNCLVGGLLTMSIGASMMAKYTSYGGVKCHIFSLLSASQLLSVSNTSAVDMGRNLYSMKNWIVKQIPKAVNVGLGVASMYIHPHPATALALVSWYKLQNDRSIPNVVSNYFLREKESINTNATAALAATVGTMYFKEEIESIFQDVKKAIFINPQTALDPSVEEIEQRDLKDKFDAEWFETKKKNSLSKLPVSTIRTTEEVLNGIENNVWKACRETPSERTNALVYKPGLVLLPWHFVQNQKEESKVQFIKHNRGNVGNQSFTCLLHPSQCVRVANSDTALCSVSKANSVSDISSYFPLKHENSDKAQTAMVMTRHNDGSISHGRACNLRFTSNAHSGCGYYFPGASYIWKHCAPGVCMSPIVSLTSRACIIGLHVGGDERNGVSFANTLCQEDLRQAEQELYKFASVLPMSEMGDFPIEQYGKRVLLEELKSKSIFLRHPETKVACFGSSLNVNRTPKTQVRDLKMKADVQAKFNLEEDWAGPKFLGPDGKSRYLPWEQGFEKWTKEKIGVPFELLNKATREYTNDLVRVFCRNFEYWEKETRVLTWDETVNGIPGKRFIGPINFSSSVGYPLKGSKNDFATNHGQKGEWQDYRTLDESIMDRAREIESLYREGKRSYDIYTSTLKDEPTLVTKDKVRVFQASSIANQLVIRKYCLTLCRFMQMNPLKSECAVGIDPKSTEWDELARHLQSSSSYLRGNRYLAMDYKAYDTSISSQMILAIGKIFEKMAKLAKYSEDELSVVRGIFNELAFPIVDFNGDVLMLDGSNPSGNPLTVFINNVSNSLLLRMFWYNNYDAPFQDHVKIICYGDDIVGGVASGWNKFNMVAYRDWASKYGLQVTAAIKDAKLTPYVSFSELDFLKRKFEYSRDLKRYVGPIQESSIFRSLCQYMKSDTDEKLIAASNIDGALDEWFFYGRKTFEERRKILKEIADEHGLSCLCNRLHLNYEQRLEAQIAADLSK